MPGSPSMRLTRNRPPGRMTRAAFITWIAEAKLWPEKPEQYEIVACACGDVNCHGWRFVEVSAPADIGRRSHD